MDVYYWQCLTNPNICSLQGLKSFRETQIQIQVQYSHKYGPQIQMVGMVASGRRKVGDCKGAQQSEKPEAVKPYKQQALAAQLWYVLKWSEQCNQLDDTFFSSFCLQRVLTDDDVIRWKGRLGSVVTSLRQTTSHNWQSLSIVIPTNGNILTPHHHYR